MHPSYINSNGVTSCHFSHETPNLNTTNHMQFNNNGRSLTAENNCLKKRSWNKDRHSKINTARGPRDRRMRLSIAVAKKFFRLQDLLGFDKASTTIEWLLMMSKPAIRDLRPQQLKNQINCSLMDRVLAVNGPSSGSECEGMPGVAADQSMEKSGKDHVITADQEKVNSCCKEKRRIDQCLAKETREKARERARKRTSEKRNVKLDCEQDLKDRSAVNQVIMDEITSQLGNWNVPFGESQQVDQLAEYPRSDSYLKQGFVGDNSTLMSNSWSPSLLLNYHHTFGPSGEHEFSDFQIVSKAWEGINN